jgi:hypothetical protein
LQFNNTYIQSKVRRMLTGVKYKKEEPEFKSGPSFLYFM